MPRHKISLLPAFFRDALSVQGRVVASVKKMASAEGERGPTAAELLLLAEMEQVLRDDWENPMHSWCALVAAFHSKNAFRISRMIRLAKTSPWTQAALEKELSSALGQQTMLDSAEDYEKDFQKAWDLEEADQWLEVQKTKQEQMANDAREWEKMHPPRYPEEAVWERKAVTQLVASPVYQHGGDVSDDARDDSDQPQAGSSDQPLF